MIKKRLLYATRAFESEPTEGGFLLLQDLANYKDNANQIIPYFFSIKNISKQQNVNNKKLKLLPIYNRPGWGISNAFRFLINIYKQQQNFDIVHSAHVPTQLNSFFWRLFKKLNPNPNTQYIQTITAIPEISQLRSYLFWGDIIICLSKKMARDVEQYHSQVHVITPFPYLKRLRNSPPIPKNHCPALSNRTVITFPIVYYRMNENFDLFNLCQQLLEKSDEYTLIFICRFKEEKILNIKLNQLLQQYQQRIIILGVIDWTASLLAVSDVVVYPIHDVIKKFNPPLVILEALCLGAKLVASDCIHLDSIEPSQYTLLSSNNSNKWVDAIELMAKKPINKKTIIYNSEKAFDDYYHQYLNLYQQLIHV